MKFLLTPFFGIFIILASVAQNPVANFNLPVNACIEEQISINNISSAAVSYKWDFCQGDFLTTPQIDNNILPASLSNVSGLKIIENNGTYFGFATSSSTNSLIRFEFGSSLQNTPTVANLGDLGILQSPEGLDIIKEGSTWIALVGHSLNGGGEIVRLVWNDLLSAPSAEKITNFGLSSRIRDVQLVKQGSDIYAVLPYYNGSTLLRINFKNSLLNTPAPVDIIQSNLLSSVQYPIGTSVVKQSGAWRVVLASILTKTISVFDLGTDISSEPVLIKSQAFTSFTNLSKIKVIAEGDNYYAFVSTSNAAIHLLNLHALLSTDLFEEISISNPPSPSGIDLIKVASKHFLLGVNTNLSRLIFEASCNTPIDYSEATEPLIQYLNSGDHSITLTAFSSDYNYDNQTKSITVSPSQAPQLTTQITGNCISSPLNFSAQELSGSIVSWNWDFGDGTGTSNLQYPVYSYTAIGDYLVKLSVTDVNGCNNLIIDTARVYEEPIPGFTAPAGNLCMNNEIVFSNSSTGETGSIVSWTWDFNGEGSSTDKEPTFTFLSSGPKTITLTSSIPGCANVTQQVITIAEAPTTNFSFSNTCNGQTAAFTDLTTGLNLVAWNWDFGDGNSSTDQNPTHTYALPGKFPVTLTVTNALGCATLKTDTIYNHAIPAINFSYDLPCSSTAIQFSDASIVQNANLVSWEWNFGDGVTSLERNPQHLYGQVGNFTVRLKAYSEFGCVDSAQTDITVIKGPDAAFSYDKGCTNETTTFTDQTNSYGQPIISFAWQIESMTYNIPNPSHTFTAPGIYPVRLSVTTSNLCTNTTEIDLIIDDPPASDFGYIEACSDNLVQFYDLTPGQIQSRSWRIDGVLTSTDSTFETSQLPGNYMISLTNLSTSGCTTVLNREISLIGGPKAAFTPSAVYGGVPLTVIFTNYSLGANTYVWTFGDHDNSSSTETNPQFEFVTEGAYEVQLIASSVQNCADTATQIIQVALPKHDISINAITLLDGGKILLILNNSGTFIYNEQNTNINFTLDNGATFTEPFDITLNPLKTINYTPNIVLGDLGNSSSLCIELVFNDQNNSLILNADCLNLIESPVISDAFPNPTSDFINLKVILSAAAPIRITIIDRSGAVIFSDDYDGKQGLNTYLLDTLPYRAGLYVIKIETGASTQEMKVVIDK